MADTETQDEADVVETETEEETRVEEQSDEGGNEETEKAEEKEFDVDQEKAPEDVAEEEEATAEKVNEEPPEDEPAEEGKEEVVNEEDNEVPAEGGEDEAVREEDTDQEIGKEPEAEGEQTQEEVVEVEAEAEADADAAAEAEESGADAGYEEPNEPSLETIGENLSRGVSPTLPSIPPDTEELKATTPDLEGTHVTEPTEEEEKAPEERELSPELVGFPELKREELIEKYYETLTEREMLVQQNTVLQGKLGEYFRKKKPDERQDTDKNVADQEQRYLKYMAQLEDLRRQYAIEKLNFQSQIEDLKEKCQEKKERVDTERRKFMEFKQHVALHAIFGRSGKPIPAKDIEQYIANEAKKEQEVVNVRLENIKIKNKLKKKEQQLKSKEELADGLHLIDFEQLKIENQTYNEKIEERNEELLKLRKKITSTVQVLTHLKEKLQFVQGSNAAQNNELQEVEASLARSRDILSRTKQARDALRIDNQKLRQNSGLLGNEPLLRDFECQKDEASELNSKLESLQMKHADLTLSCNQVRRKIDQARQVVL
ncbi:coiled-coil domain-containing protein 96-like isoform X2 [Physella acuta]|uniref:coiled-coil domain-containing protein 96-like isoform X2 n=1 Tax=Physella acuta TaxID=109671 RepID=UPI0027DE73E4|nr:coiled-coil domain-containing protein 96-like isoform X2 [Physella acuta]